MRACAQSTHLATRALVSPVAAWPRCRTIESSPAGIPAVLPAVHAETNPAALRSVALVMLKRRIAISNSVRVKCNRYGGQMQAK